MSSCDCQHVYSLDTCTKVNNKQHFAQMNHPFDFYLKSLKNENIVTHIVCQLNVKRGDCNKVFELVVRSLCFIFFENEWMFLYMYYKISAIKCAKP